MEVKINWDITGRIIELHYKRMVIAYVDENGESTTATIHNDDLSKFKLGDVIHYVENTTISRVNSDLGKVSGPPNPPRGSRPDVG